MAVESVTSSPARVVSDITELVGHTPMLRLGRIVPAESAAVFAKLEFLNPGGSIKDRAALGMILDAEARGLLREGQAAIHGEYRVPAGTPAAVELRPREMLIVAPLLAAIVFLGVWPAYLTSKTSPPAPLPSRPVTSQVSG